MSVRAHVSWVELIEKEIHLFPAKSKRPSEPYNKNILHDSHSSSGCRLNKVYCGFYGVKKPLVLACDYLGFFSSHDFDDYPVYFEDRAIYVEILKSSCPIVPE